MTTSNVPKMYHLSLFLSYRIQLFVCVVISITSFEIKYILKFSRLMFHAEVFKWVSAIIRRVTQTSVTSLNDIRRHSYDVSLCNCTDFQFKFIPIVILYVVRGVAACAFIFCNGHWPVLETIVKHKKRYAYARVVFTHNNCMGQLYIDIII